MNCSFSYILHREYRNNIVTRLITGCDNGVNHVTISSRLRCYS